MLKKQCLVGSILIFLFLSCDKENTIDIQTTKLAQGTWQGEMENDQIILTIIETTYEETIALSGTAYLMTDTMAFAYHIMNGVRNNHSLLFSLYKIPIAGKEEFHIQGSLNNAIFEGTFDQLDSTGVVIRAGEFYVTRTP